MFAEDELLPISALQHLAFCARQCALIHVEGVWADNRLTVEGRHLHERADSGKSERRASVRTARALAVRSLRLGLTGKADVVEFSVDPSGAAHPFPVEYKRGRPKQGDCDRIQLCAQALCLEEMLGVHIPEGSLFYGVTRRRLRVVFDEVMRATVAAGAARLHELVAQSITPVASREPKCDNCSLLDLCLPDALSKRRSVSRYVNEMWHDDGLEQPSVSALP